MTTTFPGDGQSVEQNVSFPVECVTVNFSQMEFLPWDNPDNIVSAEVEEICRQVRDMSLAVLFLIGGPVNVINMAVFYKQGLKERVNVCLFALSLADELSLIAAIFTHGDQLYLQFTTKEQFGSMSTFIINHQLIVLHGVSFVSPVLSMIIACERCHCVLSPLSYQRAMQTRTMTVIIGAVFLTVLGLWFIVSFRYRVGCLYDLASGSGMMAPVMGSFYRAHKDLVDFLHGVLFGLALPGLEIVVVTTTTVITIVKLRQSITWRASTSSSISPGEIALTKMLVVNSVLFVACIFPASGVRVVRLFFPEMNSGGRNQNFYLASLWINGVFRYVNSTLNFFVYFVMGSRFRDTFWALLGKKCKKDKGLKTNI